MSSLLTYCFIKWNHDYSFDGLNKDVSSLAGCDPATTSKSRTIVPFKKLGY